MDDVKTEQAEAKMEEDTAKPADKVQIVSDSSLEVRSGVLPTQVLALGSGSEISLQEFLDVLSSSTDEVGDEEAKQLFDTFDADHDGKLNLGELEDLLNEG